MIDDPDDQTDYNIAHHIVRVHQKRENPVDPPFTTAQVKRYIMYAKTLKPKVCDAFVYQGCSRFCYLLAVVLKRNLYYPAICRS